MSSFSIRPFVISLATLVSAMVAQAADAGAIFSAGEATKLLGQAVTGPLVIGPEKDDDAPAQATRWAYRAANAAVVVSRLDFASPAEARKGGAQGRGPRDCGETVKMCR